MHDELYSIFQSELSKYIILLFRKKLAIEKFSSFQNQILQLYYLDSCFRELGVHFYFLFFLI